MIGAKKHWDLSMPRQAALFLILTLTKILAKPNLKLRSTVYLIALIKIRTGFYTAQKLSASLIVPSAENAAVKLAVKAVGAKAADAVRVALLAADGAGNNITVNKDGVDDMPSLS